MSTELVAGQKIQNYEVISVLGSGGMSRVYLCEDLVLNRRVALKQLLTHEQNSRHIIRLQQEGQSLARLSHPNIVQILAFFNTEDGAPYLVMELLHGCSLAELLARSGSLTLNQVLMLASQMCDALQHAHDQGIIHRDIKPTNIFLSNKKIENAKIIDFGIAKISDNSINTTKTGEFVGSPTYLSPEQAMQKKITAKSDQYSLACVLYECLTGRPPFEDATAMGLILKHINEQPAPLSKKSFVPPAVAKAIDRALRKDPDDRFKSMVEFKNALYALSPENDKPWLPIAIVASALVLVIGLAAWVLAWSMQKNIPLSTASPSSTAPVAVVGTSTKEAFAHVLPDAQPGHAEPRQAAVDRSLDQFMPMMDKETKIGGNYDEYRLSLMLRRDPDPRQLSLVAYSITDSSLKAITTAKHCEYINLSNAKIDGDAGKYLAKMSTLERIEVSKTNVGDDFVREISVLPHLSSLALDETRVTSEGLKPLASMRTLRSIQLRSCDDITDSAGPILAQLRNLDTLDVAKCAEITDKFVASVEKLPKLQLIALTSTGVTPKCFGSLAKMKSLQTLYLDNIGGVTDLSALLHLDLKLLSLRGCNVNRKIITQLSKFKDLETLRLDRCPVTNEDLLILAQIPALKHVEISDCALLTESGVNAFKKLKPHCKVLTVAFEREKRTKRTESIFKDYDIK